MRLKNIAKKAVSALLILSFTASCTAYAASHEGFVLSGAGSWISGNIDSDNNGTVTELLGISDGGVQIPSSFTYYNDATESYETCNIKHLDVSEGYYDSDLKKHPYSGGGDIIRDSHDSVLLLPDSLESVSLTHVRYTGIKWKYFKYIVLKGTNCKTFELKWNPRYCTNVITSPGTDVYKSCIIQDIPVATGRMPRLNRTTINVTVGSYFSLQMLNTSDPSIKFSCNNVNLEYEDLGAAFLGEGIDESLDRESLKYYASRGIYVQALRPGTSTLTATYNGKEYNCVVNILPVTDDNCKQCIRDYYELDSLSVEQRQWLAKNLIDGEHYGNKRIVHNFDLDTVFNCIDGESIKKWLKSL